MTNTESIRRGGRGARDRILRAAAELFAQDGIHATGIARLTDVAQVSTRTLYQHFPSKDAIVAAYLRRFIDETPRPAAVQLAREDLDARARLLAVFLVEPTTRPDGVVRGCPFHNAAVEAAGTMPEVTELVEQHKREFTRRLAEVAAEAGARDPETLARQLALLYEGTRALSTSLNDTQPAHDAHELAKTLIDQAITPLRESSPATAS
ncbi:TetR/AcrR family transcriptional regulator [Streptomyces sp. CA-179760]|uniref:TetR/AcrR family transcriptional regulator n=1 Tax=Streptomyces sp. CA-179760 TaxID=3240054 RepID=UPI003D8FB0DC